MSKSTTQDAVVAPAKEAAAQPQQKQKTTRAKAKTGSTGNGADQAAATTATKVSPKGETPTSGDDKTKLKLCEETIRANEGSEFHIGRSLGEINRDGLYKTAGFTAFDAYCRERWAMSDKHAYRLINAADCYDMLAGHKGGRGWVLPRNETHIRELLAVDENERVSTWEKITTEFAGRTFTAEDIHAFLNPVGTTAVGTDDGAVATAKAATKVAEAKAAKKQAKEIQAKLAKIDKLVSKALEKAADKETIPVKTYQSLLGKIKELIEANK